MRNLSICLLACVTAATLHYFANEGRRSQIRLAPAVPTIVEKDPALHTNGQVDVSRPVDRFIEDAVAGLVAKVSPEFAKLPKLKPDNTNCMIPRDQVAFCFAPDSPTSLIELLSITNPSEGPRFFLNSRWSSTATNPSTGSQGDPITLTFSFPPDGTIIPVIEGVSYPAAPNNFQAWMNNRYGSEAIWRPYFESVFARWSQLCGITFVYESNDDGAIMNFTPGLLGVRGDLRIGGKALDGNSGVLAYNNFPDDGDMVFDTNDNYYNDTSSSSLKLRNIISHEHGHGMGLLHSCPLTTSKLMEPFINTNFEGPQHDDILGAQRHYGDRYEPNDSAATAVTLDPLELNESIALGDIPMPATTSASLLSIDADGDKDYFSMSLSAGALVSVDLLARGQSYLNAPQECSGQPGFCCPGQNVNSLQAANLKLQVISSDATTVLAESDQTAAGGNESIQFVLEAGSYFVAVSESDAPTKPQFYRLAISTQDLPVVAIAFPNGIPSTLERGEPVALNVQIMTEESIIPGSPSINYRRNGHAFQSEPLVQLGGELYVGELPASNCDDVVDFYVSAATVESGTHYSPVNSPANPYSATVSSYPDCMESILIPIPSRRAHLYDPHREILYITTSNGTVERWNVANGTPMAPFAIGGDLRGLDITEDGESLYVADRTISGTSGFVRKINLDTGVLTSLQFTLDGSELGSYDIAIGLGGRALVTTDFAGSGTTPMRAFTAGVDTIVQRSDVPRVRNVSQLIRSADRSRILVIQPDTSEGPVNLYNVERDALTPDVATGNFGSGSVNAANRDGTRYALDRGTVIDCLRESLSTTGTINSLANGLCYDEAEDLLYGIDELNNQVVLLNSKTNEELTRILIPEDIQPSTIFGHGESSITPDGRWLFLSTTQGIRQIRLHRPNTRLLIIRDALPQMIIPNLSIPLKVTILVRDDSIVTGSPMLHYRIGTEPYVHSPLVEQSNGEFLANLPGIACDQTLSFYLSVEGVESGMTTSPATAELNPITMSPNAVPDCTETIALPFTRQTDVIFDDQRGQLYATTKACFLDRFDFNSGKLLKPLNLGWRLGRMDMSPDGNCLYICEEVLGVGGVATIHKIDLSTESVTAINFAPSPLVAPPNDLAVLSNNIALTCLMGDSSSLLYQIDLLTNAVSPRSDLPIYLRNSRMARSQDYHTLLIASPNNSNGPISTFSAITNSLIASGNNGFGFGSSLSSISVNHDGSQLVLANGGSIAVRNRDLSLIGNLSVQNGAVAFDQSRDVIYRCNSETDQIHAFSSTTLIDLDVFPAETDLPLSNGSLYTNHDGTLLAAGTASGLQLIATPSHDCNNNGIADLTELAEGAVDCNHNGLLDVCELEFDCNANLVPDACDFDCNQNGIPDDCDILTGAFTDCDENGELDDCQFDNGNINRWMQYLAASHPSITSLVPNRFDFTDGATGSSISDGGSNMYDSGNRLTTNFSTNFPYTNNTVSAATTFGPGSLYFTAKYPGIFVLAARGMSISTFEIRGGLGADGNGSVDGATIPLSVSGNSFTLFLKRVWGTATPSVNHLVIVDGFSAGITHTFPNDTNNDQDTYAGLTGRTRLFYILVSRQSGQYLSDQDATSIATEFIEGLHLALLDCNLNGNFDACDITAGPSQDANSNGIPDECESIVFGDMNCDSVVNLADVPLFVTALVDPSNFSGCSIVRADLNQDNLRNSRDLSEFVTAILTE